jgi:serine/threonine protein kinase
MDTDRNLLFGILAVQMNFITRDALITAMNAWVLDKHKALGKILAEQGQLSAERLQLLDALVNEHVKVHGNDPQQSLAALSSASSVKPLLQQVQDGDVQASIAAVGSAWQEQSTEGERPATGCRYRILRPHAQGGLGEVFVAEDTELHRQVALKEIKVSRAHDPQSQARFLLEGEITGGLEHPGIVPVYGLGHYGDGRPYYAMRFIKGDNLKEAIERFHNKRQNADYADERREKTSARIREICVFDFSSLEFRQLLRRFIDVCNAVAYAHSRGVLHRDLKPGNILLGKYGETLVVDWGLAKVVGRRDTDTPDEEATLRPSSGSSVVETQAGAAVGTPAYMSPEQAAGRLEELGPASDVYSLGATLYAVLTGRPPFADAYVAEVLKKVERGDFPPPRQVHPAVPPPLEAVCRKAMALRPGDRYGTPLDLAAELEHWLADEPVRAYGDPVLTRAARWARKRRALVSSAAALLITAVCGLAVGLAAVEREREKTKTERDEKANALIAVQRAREAEKKARELTMGALRSLTDDVVEKQMALRPQLTDEERRFMRNVLQHYEALAAINSDDIEGRAIRAEGQWRVGTVHSVLGELNEAEAAHTVAVNLFTQLAKDVPTRPEFRRGVANNQSNLAFLFSVAGRRAEAAALSREALALKKQLVVDFPARLELRLDLAAEYLSEALHCEGLNQLKEAETAFRDGLALLRQLPPDFGTGSEVREAMAQGLYNLGFLLRSLKRSEEAQIALGESLAINKQLIADFPSRTRIHEALALNYSYLGRLHRDNRRWEEAGAAFSNALATCKKLATDFPAQPGFRLGLANGYVAAATSSATPNSRKKPCWHTARALPCTCSCLQRIPTWSDTAIQPLTHSMSEPCCSSSRGRI